MFRLRFDMRAPGRTADEVARLYETALEMSAWADDHGLPGDRGLGAPRVRGRVPALAR